MGIAQVVAIVAIAGGAVAAFYAERATMHRGLGVLAHTRVGWVLVGVGAEFVSMAAFGQLERLLLRAAGARLTLRAVLATAYNANAIAVSVPVVGSAIAAAYAFRDFRRGGADAGQASVALTVAGVFSAVAFAVIAALGVALTGNPAAAPGPARKAQGVQIGETARPAFRRLIVSRPPLTRPVRDLLAWLVPAGQA